METNFKPNVLYVKLTLYGHIKSLKNGGTNDMYNFVPICQTCNLSMGIENLYEFQKKI